MHPRIAPFIVSLLMAAGSTHAQLVAHWVADDWNGTGDWVDRISSNRATVFGNPKVSPNLFITAGTLKAIALDGDDAFNVAPAASAVVGAPRLTVIATFRTTVGGSNINLGGGWWDNSGIVGGEAIGGHNDWGVMLLKDGRVQGGFRDQGREGGYVLDGRIHSAALTWDGGTGELRAFVDGMLIGSKTSATGVVANFGFAIGQFQDDGFTVTNRSNFFTGEIGEVRLYTSVEDVEVLHSNLVGCVASVQAYGQGTPGNRSITPPITVSAQPVFNTTINLVAFNTTGAPTAGLVLVGQQPASTPFAGGTLLVQPVLSVPVVIPAAGLAIPLAIPNLGAACTRPGGMPFYVQVLERDAMAPAGVSMTPGLRLLVGSR